MRYAIIVLALLGVLASPRPAAALTGNQLLKTCGSDDIEGLACVYYVVGWNDAFGNATIAQYGLQPNFVSNPIMGICLPIKVTNGQMVDVLLKYLRAHPEKRHEGSWELTAHAMKKAWPCR